MEKLKEFLNFSFEITKDIHIDVRTLLFVIVVFLLTSLLLKLIKKIVNKKLNEEDKGKFKAVFSFIKYFVYTIVLVVALESSGIKLSVLLAGSAALLVGIGLGLQTLFQDVISGIFILIDKTITVNDIIEIDKKVGKVTQVSLRTTKAITNDDKILVIPNHKFLNEILYNWTQNNEVTREFVDIGVAYGTDIDLVKALLLGIAVQEDAILNKPKPMVFFEDFGDSALKFRLHFYINDSFHVPLIKSDLRYRIHKSFKENNISIPFPQRDIHIVSKE